MRSVWDDELSKLRFSVLDILAVLVEKEQYVKVRN